MLRNANCQGSKALVPSNARLEARPLPRPGLRCLEEVDGHATIFKYAHGVHRARFAMTVPVAPAVTVPVALP
jgi:hypothetical protein